MKIRNIILKIIFLIGVSLLLYPLAGSIINEYIQLKTINKYSETINIVNNENIDKMYEEAVSYNEDVYIRQKEDRRYDLTEKYNTLLKIDDTNIIGYINIPSANIKLPIYHGVEDTVLQKGVGHVKESSLPIGTNNQNSMLMGHSGLPSSKVFTNLEKLKVGDYFQISILKRKLNYKINKIEVIEPKELIYRLPIIEGKDLITLVTCTPYGVNSHRLVIQAERTNEPIIINDNKQDIKLTVTIIICIVVLLLLVALLFILRRKKNKNKQLLDKKVAKKSVNKTDSKKDEKKKAVSKKANKTKEREEKKEEVPKKTATKKVEKKEKSSSTNTSRIKRDSNVKNN